MRSLVFDLVLYGLNEGQQAQVLAFARDVARALIGKVERCYKVVFAWNGVKRNAEIDALLVETLGCLGGKSVL
jgi:hypothetical protein